MGVNLLLVQASSHDDTGLLEIDRETTETVVVYVGKVDMRSERLELMMLRGY
jgi:hypothetical protein